MKWLLLMLGGVLLLLGAATLLLPIPTGLPLLAAGTAVLYPRFRWVRVRVRLLARRYGPVAELFARLRSADAAGALARSDRKRRSDGGG